MTTSGSAGRGSAALRQRRGRRSPRNSQRPDTVGPRIVVIDGEAAARRVWKMLLTKKGFIVSVTASPRRGLKLVTAQKPVLVMLNLATSGTDGLDALRAMKAYDEMTPVIVTVTFAKIRMATEDVRLGAFEYVSKPFDLGYIDALVDSVLLDGLTIASEPAMAAFPEAATRASPRLHPSWPESSTLCLSLAVVSG